MHSIITETEHGLVLNLNSRGERVTLTEGRALTLRVAGTNVDVKADEGEVTCVSRLPSSGKTLSWAFCRESERFRLKNSSFSYSGLGNLETLIYDMRLEFDGVL